MSSGSKNALIEAIGYLSLIGGIFFSVLFFDDLKAVGKNLFEAGEEVVVASREAAATQMAGMRKTKAEVTYLNNSERRIVLRSNRHGQFYARVWINGREIKVLVDTGAWGVALTHNDAEKIGIFPRPADYTGRVNTANGRAAYAPVTLDNVRIGDIEVSDVRGSVATPGRLHITLLGMTFLNRIGRVEVKGDKLILTQ